MGSALTLDVAKGAAPQKGWEGTWDQARPAKDTEWLQVKATGWQEAVCPEARHDLGGEPSLDHHASWPGAGSWPR